jgi:hypothetical protein
MRNRHFQVKLVKDQPSDQISATEAPKNSPETIVIESVRGVAPYALGLFVAAKSVNLLYRVALHTAETKIK